MIFGTRQRLMRQNNDEVSLGIAGIHKRPAFMYFNQEKGKNCMGI